MLPPLHPTPQAIDDALAQTECRQCGFDGCAAYAEAIASGLAPINRCAPGGARGIARLAALTGLPETPLDPEFGREMPFARARIRAMECIGCAWCVRACPTDAIAGAPKHLHAVIEERCTGCSLCAPACPMDCIEFVEAGREWTAEDARLAKRRHEEAWARRIRRAAAEDARLERLRSAPSAPAAASGAQSAAASSSAQRAARNAASREAARKRFMADILAMARGKARA